MNLAIVGAGPVGSYISYLLSKQGFKVHLFDQKTFSQIGYPVQCTGLLTPEIKKFIPLSQELLVNTFSSIQVYSPQNKKITFHKTEYLIDRPKFDQHLFNLALKQGTVFYPQHRLIKIEKNQRNKISLTFQYKNKIKIFSFDIFIAADGPLSLAYLYLNSEKKKKFYYGQQAIIKGKFDCSVYQTFFGSKVCPYLFAWLVPESKNKARVGLATLKEPNFYFNQFLKQQNINPNQIIQKQAGLIPLFDPQAKTHRKNIYLLGDAASQVKATTLGGLVPAFREAQNLASSLIKGQPYQPNLKNLKLHLFLRKTLDKFSDQDYDYLIYLLSKLKAKKLLETYSRENPKKLLRKLILKEPRFLYFARHLF